MNEIIIVGAGGHARVIADIIKKNHDKVVGFLDDDISTPSEIMGIPYLGTVSEIKKYSDRFYFIIGIGNNNIRKKIAESYKVKWYTAIHSSAEIAENVTIDEGSVVMAKAVINTFARIKKHCIINTGAVIEHDNIIGSYSHISPNATLCGTVSVGECTHIGAGAVVKNNISICDKVTVGIGGIVVRNIDVEGTYIGVPVRII